MTDFARLHTDVVFGRSGGKIIWQPRIGCWYHDKLFAGEPLPEPYTGLSVPDIHRSLGCSARLYDFNGCFRRIDHPSVIVSTRQLNETHTETTIQTPVGKQIKIDRKTPTSGSTIRVKAPIATLEELKVATWIEENADWEWDQDRYDELQRDLGDLGAPTAYMPRSNVQDLYINTMGVQDAVYAIIDWPDEIEAYFRALAECHFRRTDVIGASPIDIINFGENVHAGTLSPELFLKYHLPGCAERCERLHAAGKFVSSHWDGDCGPLLPHARETGLDAIEAITPVPQGDVTLEQVRDALGDEMFLLDGLPAIYFDDTFEVDTLVECTHKIIELFAPRLVLGISDEISSTGDIERIRIVGDIVDEYNAGCDG